METTEIICSFDQASEDRIAGGAMSSPDLERYRPYVAHLDMPEARKADLLLAVWRIMQNAVDRAFGDDPVQRRHGLGDKGCGKDESAALPVIDLDNDEAGKTLSDSFHQHVIGENKKEKR